jgi:hypothetical protein
LTGDPAGAMLSVMELQFQGSWNRSFA